MFYDYTLYIMKCKNIINEIGQQITIFEKSDSFVGDIQPVTGQTKTAMGWGDDVKSQLTLYTDTALKVGDVVEYNNVMYEVEKSITWDYFVYGLKGLEDGN